MSLVFDTYGKSFYLQLKDVSHMLAIPLKIELNEEDTAVVREYRRIYSSMFRFSYNRKRDGMTSKETRAAKKKIAEFNTINSWFFDSCLNEVAMLNPEDPERKVIFGGRQNFIKRLKGEITKEEFQKCKLRHLCSTGQAAYSGNRLFELDVIANSQIIFKPDRHTRIIIKIPKLHGSHKKDMFELERRAKRCEAPFTVRLTENEITVMYDEFLEGDVSKLRNNRFMSIDSNPNHIGMSICEYTEGGEYKVLHTHHYDITEMNKKLSSSKINREIHEISKAMMNLAVHHRCGHVFVEDLTIKSEDHGKGHAYNWLVNQVWKRNELFNNIKKRCNQQGLNYKEANPAYSSYIGNAQYDYTDPINSSLEIGRRGYEYYVLKNKDSFYPKVRIKESMLHRWKETDVESLTDWKKVAEHMKNSGMGYRVPMDEAEKHHSVYRQEYIRPIGLIAFICK